MKLHSKKAAALHKDLAQSYKDRKDEIEDFEESEEEKNTSFERSYLHNAIYLHNLWFEQVDHEKTDTECPFFDEILEQRESDRSSFVKWMNEFARDAKPNGWVIWGWSYPLKTFVGFPIKSHDQGVPLGVAPLIVVDCWEHSYMEDFGLDFEAYLDMFWKLLDWEVIDLRHKELAKLFGYSIK